MVEQEKPLSGRCSSWSTLLAGSLIILAGWAAYSNSFRGTFTNDDHGSILDNPTIRHLWPLGTVFFPPGHGNTVGGRPILNLSFAINYAWGGIRVWDYHATNLAIHLLNGLLLLGILRRTFLSPALQPRLGRNALLLASAIALLWVVHPLTTEAVTYMVQRAESLASLFYLLVLYAVIRGVQSGRRLSWYAIAIGGCWLGVATKEIVVTAPVVVLCYDRTFLAGTFCQAWRQRWGLYLGLATAWLVMAALMVVVGGRDESAGFGHGMTSGEYAATQGGAILHYVRQSLWPTGLRLFYGNPVARTPATILPGALFVLVLASLTGWAWKRRSGLGFLGLFFFAAIAPSSSFIPIVDETLAERRMYLALAAVITLLVIGAYLIGQRWIVRGRLAIGLCLVSLAAGIWGYLTFQRNRDYCNELPIEWGNTLATMGRWSEAAEYFQEMVRLNPQHVDAYYHWGGALLSLKQPSEAIPCFEQAIHLRPNYVDIYNSYGIALLSLGRPSEAIERFKTALRIDPSYAEAHNNWGIALLMLGRPLEAIEHYEQTLRLNPKHADAHYNWAKTLLALGHPAEAIQHCKQAVQLKPDYAAAHNIWGNAYLALGQPADAIPQYEQALQIDSSYAEARSNWGIALSQLGRWTEAIEQYQQALRILPKSADSAESASVHLNLAMALAHVGQLDEAFEHGREAMRLLPNNPQVKEINKQLQLYRDRKPYHVSSG